MEPWIPGFITGTLALIAAIVTGLLQSRRERNADRRRSATPGAPTVQEIWQRQDRMENAFKASLVLLGEVVEQHEDPSKLVLSRSAIQTLREGKYLPPELEDVLTK